MKSKDFRIFVKRVDIMYFVFILVEIILFWIILHHVVSNRQLKKESNVESPNLDLAYTYPKKGAMVLLFNQGKVLSVSRKNDPSKVGLVGGKVDEGETFLQAAIREAKEETGLDVFGLIPVFSRMDGDFFCVVYIGQWKGDIHKTSEKETGVVSWVSWDELKSGPFGEYNAALEQHLIRNKLI